MSISSGRKHHFVMKGLVLVTGFNLLVEQTSLGTWTHSTQYTVHQYIVNSTQYTVHSTHLDTLLCRAQLGQELPHLLAHFQGLQVTLL